MEGIFLTNHVVLALVLQIPGLRPRAVKSVAKGQGQGSEWPNPAMWVSQWTELSWQMLLCSLLELERMPGVCWLHPQPSNHVNFQKLHMNFHRLPWLDVHLVGSGKSPRRDLLPVGALLPVFLTIISSHRWWGNGAVRTRMTLRVNAHLGCMMNPWGGWKAPTEWGVKGANTSDQYRVLCHSFLKRNHFYSYNWFNSEQHFVLQSQSPTQRVLVNQVEKRREVNDLNCF